MMKKRNKGKKALTTVGAVVVAGLTPGFIAATPGCLPSQNTSVEITAAEVVAIDGNTYSFDELYAMQQVDRTQRQKSQPKSQPQTRPQRRPQQACKYGAPSVPGTQIPPSTLYGVPRPKVPKEQVVFLQSDTERIQMDILAYLMEYCSLLIDADKRGIIITPDSDLTKHLGMTEDELKDLKAEIEDCYGVEVSYHRFRLIGQLNTLRLISEYITNIKTLWD